MNNIIKVLSEQLKEYLAIQYPDTTLKEFIFQPTSKEHTGHLTLMVFPIAKALKANPEQLANELGKILSQSEFIEKFNVIKGFLNLYFSNDSLKVLLGQIGEIQQSDNPQNIVLEYGGPNTNKPIHIGHLRNMFLGYSVAEILRRVGHTVHKVNIFNDRGIAICKSMLAYKLYGNNQTPTSAGIKSDFFVGNWYVKFNEVYKQEIEELKKQGKTKEEAEVEAPIYRAANDMLMLWEAGDKETIDLWNKMNDWFYEGVRETYARLGMDTEKDYYESQEYKKGKEIVALGYESGVFQKEPDGAIYIDLTDKGLDKKYLQRANGTSLYITQDMALVKTRFDDYKMDKMIYVVADEQNYHFKVLKYIVEAMNEPFSKDIYHLSYGLVLGKNGEKFKSRDGTPADADGIVDMGVVEAKKQVEQSGKADTLSPSEIADIAEKVGVGAVKFSLLKVTATKNVIFNPKEAVDVHGDTGSFIQYTYVRTKSLLAKWNEPIESSFPEILAKEEEDLVLQLATFGDTIWTCVQALDPSDLANYTLQLAKSFNRFYTQLSILNIEKGATQQFRLFLTLATHNTIENCLKIMGIPQPERM